MKKITWRTALILSAFVPFALGNSDCSQSTIDKHCYDMMKLQVDAENLSNQIEADVDTAKNQNIDWKDKTYKVNCGKIQAYAAAMTNSELEEFLKDSKENFCKDDKEYQKSWSNARNDEDIFAKDDEDAPPPRNSNCDRYVDVMAALFGSSGRDGYQDDRILGVSQRVRNICNGQAHGGRLDFFGAEHSLHYSPIVRDNVAKLQGRYALALAPNLDSAARIACSRTSPDKRNRWHYELRPQLVRTGEPTPGSHKTAEAFAGAADPRSTNRANAKPSQAGDTPVAPPSAGEAGSASSASAATPAAAEGSASGTISAGGEQNQPPGGGTTPGVTPPFQPPTGTPPVVTAPAPKPATPPATTPPAGTPPVATTPAKPTTPPQTGCTPAAPGAQPPTGCPRAPASTPCSAIKPCSK